MEGYKKRMMAESLQLAQRIDNLQKFVDSEKYNELDAANQILLTNQLFFMQGYFNNLNCRIDLNVTKEEMDEFEKEVNESDKD